MCGKEGFILQRTDRIWIAAGNKAVRRIREQRARHGVDQQLIRIRERALHLIQHHAGARQHAVLQLIMPALLLKDLLLFVNAREKDGVEVDAHEVEEVLIVAARDRVAGPVRKGQRIQEGIERALQQLYERFLDRIVSGAAENGVFQNMEYAGIVKRQRAEGGAEALVLVRALEPAQSRAGLRVGIFMQHRPQLRDAALTCLFKSVCLRHNGSPFPL